MNYLVPHVLVIGYVLLATSGCGGSDESEAAEVQSSCERIVGGRADAGHSAVAALTDAFGKSYCSGTLIGELGAQGVVLTAAHCLDAPLSTAVFGDDYLSPLVSAHIGRAVAHPEFDASTGKFDLAILILDDEVSSVAPIRTPKAGEDALGVGDSVEFVGFGDTGEASGNSRKNTVQGTVDTLTTARISYRQSSGGPCTGDSGGPSLRLLHGLPLVVGVTSFGEGGCWSRGVSTRVQASSSFIDTFIEADHCGAI